MSAFDLAIIGAGPAGMAAAVAARMHGVSVIVLDEQPTPGGQIWRGIERMDDARRLALFGADHDFATSLLERFRASGATYWPGAQVWQAERGWTLFATRERKSVSIEAKHVLIAIGALERAMPFRGWTLPGVMTVGAAQIVLKESGLLPKGPVVIAGQGPLPLLYATQMLQAGARPDAVLLTTPAGTWRRAVPHVAGALLSWPYLLKGAAMLAKLRAARVPIISGVADVVALGEARVTSMTYAVHGRPHRRDVAALLVHDGVVPHTHMSMALGAAHTWDAAQWCYRPTLDDTGRSSVSGLSIAGDAGGIGGAMVAIASGARAAHAIAHDLGRVAATAAVIADAESAAALRKHRRIRPFLDAIYTPASIARPMADDVIVCRCEEKTAGDIRKAVREGCLGPAQVKSFTRAGMGPCQGRQCALSIATLIAEARGVAIADIDPPRIRPPLKPVTLGELAVLVAKPS